MERTALAADGLVSVLVFCLALDADGYVDIRHRDPTHSLVFAFSIALVVEFVAVLLAIVYVTVLVSMRLMGRRASLSMSSRL